MYQDQPALPNLADHQVNALLGQIKLQLSAAERAWSDNNTRVDFRRQNTDRQLRCALREIARLRDRVTVALSYTKKCEGRELRQTLPGLSDDELFQPVERTPLVSFEEREGRDVTRNAE